MVAMYERLEDFILKDIARRTFLAGHITATADRLMWKLEQMGQQREEIQKKIANILQISLPELRELLQGAVLTSWEDDAPALEQITGTPPQYPLDNSRVISVMNAEYMKSRGELQNLTRSAIAAANSDLGRLLDEAEMRVASGAQSYNQAIRDVLDGYAGHGFYVTYPSGQRMTLEAAVRMCVVTSMNQTAAQVTNAYIVQAGTNYVLVSAHLGARVASQWQPLCADHEGWQGRVYCIRGSEEGFPNLLAETGYDIDPVTGQGTVVNPLGLHGYNCRHGHRPFDKSLRNPYLDSNGRVQIRPEENEEAYRNQQRQRAMERSIRRTKRRLAVKAAELEIATPDERADLQNEYDELDRKLRDQNRVYNEYCKETGLAPQYDRMRISNNVPVATPDNHDKINASDDTGDKNVHILGKINRDLYKCISDNISSDEVVITNERIEHIIERRGEGFYRRFKDSFIDILHDPDYIFPDKRGGTAIISKRFIDDGKYINVVMRLTIPGTPDGYKNSILTVIGEGEKRFAQRLRNNTVLYKKE